MPKSTKLFMVALAVVFSASDGWSQVDTTPVPKPAVPPKYFRLDFVVKDMEGGKQVNARNYSVTASTGGGGNNCSVRAGDKVPTATAKDGSQFTYLDVGVNLDCREMKELEGKLTLTISADITSAANEPPSAMPPVIRRFNWSSNVIVPLRKATVVYSSDGASSKRGMELELTATPIP